MTVFRLLAKELTAPASATSGVAGYDLEGQRKKRGKRLVVGAGVVELVAKTADTAAHEAAASPFNLKRPPTEGQVSAGNYAKGHVNINGLHVAIENPAGSHRRPEWPELTAHYGYAKRTEGADGDGVDVFVKVGTPLDYEGPVFVIDQRIDGCFDEHKCMVGWRDIDAASKAYLSNYGEGWDGLGAITRMELPEFKDWLKNGDTKAPVSRDFNQGETQ